MVFEALQAPACHENMVKVGGYILGEFGNLIAKDPASAPLVQFKLLHSKFPLCSVSTRIMLLNTYAKFANVFSDYEGVRRSIEEVLASDTNIRNSDVELQQRASEYYKLITMGNTEVILTVLDEMPAFPEKESSLLAKLKKKQNATEASGDTPVVEKKPMPAATTNMGSTNGNLSGRSTPEPSFVDTRQQADLLGLDDDLAPSTGFSSFPAAAATPAQQSLDPLFGDIFSAPPPAMSNGATTVGSIHPTAEDAFKRFILSNTGVLYEDDKIQISVQIEPRQSLAQLSIYYGNRSPYALVDFQVSCILPGDLPELLAVSLTPTVSTRLEAGSQTKQPAEVTCKSEYRDRALFNVSFTNSGTREVSNLSLYLPIPLNKFFQPVVFNAADFFMKWKQLSESTQESQKIFTARHPIDTMSVQTKLQGFGMALLLNIDPNPQNFVCAGILSTLASNIGVLLRLEPNLQSNMYRLTVRSLKQPVAETVALLLQDFF
jgi:AP-2 complex subunit alpha